MPYMKITKRFKGMKKKVGEIVLIEDDEIKDGISVDTEGNEYPTTHLAALTQKEMDECFKVEELQI